MKKTKNSVEVAEPGVNPLNIVNSTPPDNLAELIDKLPPEVKERALELAARRKAIQMEDDFALFFREAWKILRPADPLEWSWHYDYLAEYLETVADGTFKERFPGKRGIIINVPPRTAKSNFVTVAFPVWTWIKNPALRYFACSYSYDLSKEHSVMRRDLIESDWFQGNWGDKFQIRADRDRQELFGNNKTGDMLASSVGGSLTGKGGHIGIIDDPLSGKDGASEAARKNANDWVHDTFFRRFDNPAKAITLIVMQRLHDDDVTGHLLDEDPNGWIHVMIPLEAEEETIYTFPVSGRVFVRPQGDILQPGRFSPEVVAQNKAHSRTWFGQYQQSPAPKGGIIFQSSWWKYYTQLPALSQVAISVDAAFKDRQQNDYVSIQVWGFTADRAYLIDKHTEHLGYTATKAAIKGMKVKYPRAFTCLIEDKANGSAIIEELRRERTGMNIIAVNPEGGKESRAEASAPCMEAGNVYLPEGVPWVHQLVLDCSKFPNVKNDDDIDAMTQILIWRLKNTNGFLAYYKKKAAEDNVEDVKLSDLSAEELRKQTTEEKVAAWGSLPKRKKILPTAKIECPCGAIPSEYGESWHCNACGRKGEIKLSNPTVGRL